MKRIRTPGVAISMPPQDADDQHVALVDRARPIFAGQHPAVIGSALAELVAIWLAGHQVSREDHQQLLELHVETVRDLLPVVEAEIGTRSK